MTPPIPDRIRSKSIRQTVGLMRYEAKLQADILEMLDTLGADLVRGLLGAGLDTPRTDWQRARLQAMLKEVKTTIQTAFLGIESHHADEMAGLIKVSGKGIVTAINEAIGADLLIPPKWTMEQLRAIASNVLIEGAPSSAWWTRQADGVLEDFADAMRKGMLRGETVTQLRDRIMGQDIRGVNGIGKIDLRTVPIADRAVIKTARRNAEALVRTSVISTANTAHLEAFRANDDIMDGVEWCSTLDSRTTVICMHLDGLRWDLGRKPLGHSTPFPGATAHWGCFAEGTQVYAKGVHAKSKRLYTGNMVVVRTSSGKEISVTPNHPILTDSGWVKAGLIKKGDQVVCCGLRKGMAAGVNPNHEEVESSIEDVSVPALGSGEVFSVEMPTSAHDLHGDGAGSEVAIIWANRPLRYTCEPSVDHHGDQQTLRLRGLDVPITLPAHGHFDALLHGASPALSGQIGGSRNSGPLFRGGISHSHKHGVTPVTDRLSGIFETSKDCRTTNIEALCNGLDTLSAPIGDNDFFGREINPLVKPSDSDSVPGEVIPESFAVLAYLLREFRDGLPSLISLDEVTEVRDWPGFVGHVYNLETAGGWYAANGIVAHNCRSSQIGVTKSWEDLAREAGGDTDLARKLDSIPVGDRASMGGPVSGNLRYADWFEEQSEAFQRSTLGPGKYELWRKGKIGFSDMVDQRGNPLTLKELEEMFG